MTKYLKIADGLKLPLDSVLAKKAILAKTGAGKSNTAATIVEETMDAKIPVIILDPKGDWWGLKSSADGKSEGYPILIFGGDHGDMPLDPSSGKMVAEYLVEGTVSAIVDVSEFNKRQLYEFCGDFLTAFYAAKKKSPSPVLLVIEEADEVAPQKLTNAYGPALPICLGAAEKVVKRGRFLGIGTLVVTQRSASLNKDILTQTDILIIQRTTAPQDVDAVEAWIEHHPDQEKRKEVLSSIQSLKNGEAFVWWPEAGMFVRTMFRLRKTFDSGRTPKIGETKMEPKVLAKADLEALKGRMAELVEKAKTDDPKNLKNKIATLEKQLSSRPAIMQEKVVEKIVEKKVPMEYRFVSGIGLGMGQGMNKKLDEINQAVLNLREWISKEMDDHDKAYQRMAADGVGITYRGMPPANKSLVQDVAPIGVHTEKALLEKARSFHKAHREPVVRHSPAQTDGGGTVAPVPQKILNELAELDAVGIPRPDRAQLAFFCGYTNHKSGGFSGPLGNLIVDGYIAAPKPGFVELTGKGRITAAAVSTPRTTLEFQERLLSKMDGPRAKILAKLIELHPTEIDRATLGSELGYSNHKSGGFSGPLGSLVALSMVETPRPGVVRASDRLFLEV